MIQFNCRSFDIKFVKINPEISLALSYDPATPSISYLMSL